MSGGFDASNIHLMHLETQADERDGDAFAGDCRIYVGNLIPKANELHLQKVFCRFGVIHNVWVARKPPGFAFVTYESHDQAQKAVDVCSAERAIEILGKPVKVQMAGAKADSRRASGSNGSRQEKPPGQSQSRRQREEDARAERSRKRRRESRSRNSSVAARDRRSPYRSTERRHTRSRSRSRYYHHRRSTSRSRSSSRRSRHRSRDYGE